MVKKQATQRTAGALPGGRMATDDAKPASLRAQVLLAARKRCDDMQDGPEAREQMKRDVLETPVELLADLMAAFSSARVMRADFPTTNPPQE
jgi:hypothetical protein